MTLPSKCTYTTKAVCSIAKTAAERRLIFALARLVCKLVVFVDRELKKAENRARRLRGTQGDKAIKAAPAAQAARAARSAQAPSGLVLQELLTPADFERGGRWERKRAAGEAAMPPPKRPSPAPLPVGVRESAFGEAAARRVLGASDRATDFERITASKFLIGLGSNPNQPIQEPTPPEAPATPAAPAPAVVAAAAEVIDLEQQQQHDGRAGEPEPRRAPSSSSAAAKLTYSVWLVDAESNVETPVLGLGREEKEEDLWEDGFARIRSHCVRLGFEPVVEVLTPANGLVAVDDQRSWDQAVDAVRQRPMMEGIVRVRLSARSGRGGDGV